MGAAGLFADAVLLRRSSRAPSTIRAIAPLISAIGRAGDADGARRIDLRHLPVQPLSARRSLRRARRVQRGVHRLRRSRRSRSSTSRSSTARSCSATARRCRSASRSSRRRRCSASTVRCRAARCGCPTKARRRWATCCRVRPPMPTRATTCGSAPTACFARARARLQELGRGAGLHVLRRQLRDARLRLPRVPRPQGVLRQRRAAVPAD